MAIRVRLLWLLLVCFGTAAPALAQTLDSLHFGPDGGNGVVALQPDGRAVIGGDFATVGSIPRARIARINKDETVDLTFDPGADARVQALAVQTDGKIVVGGQFNTLGGAARAKIGRLNADGSIDPTFNPGAAGPAGFAVTVLIVQQDNKILVGGSFTHLGGGGTVQRLGLARLNPDGSIDGGFNPGTSHSTLPPGLVSSMALQADGKIVVGGTFEGLGGGTGTSPRKNIGRLNDDGTVDGGFDPGADAPVRMVAVQADGKVLAGGAFTRVGGSNGFLHFREFIARINIDGTVDTAFDPPITNEVQAIALQTDGRIVIGGLFTQPTIRNYLARLNSTGDVDVSFDPGADGPVRGITIQPDGRVIVTGDFTMLGGGGLGNAPRAGHGRFINTGPAVESLTTTGTTTVDWQRGGTSPEVLRVAFETSLDGVTYTPLGWASRVAGGWRLTGLSLAPDPNRRLRARAYFNAGQSGGSTMSIIETDAPMSSTNLIQNGDFSDGTNHWLTFALPDPSGMTFNVTGQVFQYYRTGTQGVVFQQTGVGMPARATLEASFKLGNADTVRKRISILLHDADFTDLSVCTFWLPPATPLTEYTMRAPTTRQWTDATISIYAASQNAGGNTTGFYRLDDVTLMHTPAHAPTATTCFDPKAPTPPGGAPGSDMIVNGDFQAGLSPWGLFGQINGAVNAGVFEFVKLPGNPAGVVLQPTGQAVAANQIVTATFQIGNSSIVRKRVTVILHDADFSDLSACTFWLEPTQALTTYTYRTFSTDPWTNATFSLYPATLGNEQWIRLDNVTLRQTPGAALSGTHCIEPGGAVPDEAPPSRGWSAARSSNAGPVVDVDEAAAWHRDGFDEAPSEGVGASQAFVAAADREGVRVLEWRTPLDLTGATTAVLRFRSWLTSAVSRAEVQISTRDEAWETVAGVAPSDALVAMEIDLSAYTGRTIRVRFVLTTPTDHSDSQAGWRIDDVGVVTDNGG